ncbi:MAG: hypothetical protein JSS08_01255 [Proteobacteria bacterium]|nr:hypothetical protein [Pseudomonadota bacterium]
MSRQEYRKARKLIRENGRFAIRWLNPQAADIMDVLFFGQIKDRLAERADIVAYCKREGLYCNPRMTA